MRACFRFRENVHGCLAKVSLCFAAFARATQIRGEMGEFVYAAR